MEWLNNIISYFLQDPTRILTWIGGSGGVLYYVDRFRNRPRLRIRILHVNPHFADMHLTFEAENLGTIPTSLEPTITLIGYTPLKKKRQFILEIPSGDRNLPPHSPKPLEATIKSPEAIIGALCGSHC